MTWTSAGQDGSGKGIYSQRYNSSAAAQGTQTLVNTTTTGDQSKSSIAIDAGGDYYVTWQNAGVTANGLQMNAQQFKKNGNKEEGEFVVNATTAGDQSNASVAIDLLGRAVIVWSGNGAGDTSGVFLQRYRIDLHGLEAAEHDHGQADEGDHADDDGDFDIDPILDAMYGRHEQSDSHQHDVNPGSGVQTARHFDQQDARRRTDLPEPRSTTESTDWVRTGRRHAGLAELAELPTAIDSLFGSDAWLSGRHYRGANARA